MKDESKRSLLFVSEFVVLRSKMYSLIAVDGEEIIKAKGRNKNIVKNIRLKELIGVLFNNKIMRHEMERIQSK